jgi:hypothetical protein
MASKGLLIVLAVLCGFLAYRVLRLESAMHQLQRNTAIAVLSAEIANKKIGAFAPYFGEDKEAFANAWIDGSNMPGAVFPDYVLVPLQNELARRRSDPLSQKLKAETSSRLGLTIHSSRTRFAGRLCQALGGNRCTGTLI